MTLPLWLASQYLIYDLILTGISWRATVGTVKVSPASVSAEGMVDLTVKYTATKHLAERASKATAAEDLNSTYGRIQIMLPAKLGS